jgi:hypothetical protein
MQQNTWRYQTFCYMIQHYNAYFKIVRLQKSKISIKMSLNILRPHKKNSLIPQIKNSECRKKNIPRSRKRCHDQEKFIKTKRTSQRSNSKDSGNYQKQIPLPYGTQNTQQMIRKDLIRTNYHEKITIRYPEK